MRRGAWSAALAHVEVAQQIVMMLPAGCDVGLRALALIEAVALVGLERAPASLPNPSHFAGDLFPHAHSCGRKFRVEIRFRGDWASSAINLSHEQALAWAGEAELHRTVARIVPMSDEACTCHVGS